MLNLTGKTTDGGWLVEEAVEFASDHTGGYFSSCFFATKNGQRAFLKALDIEKFDIGSLLGILAGFEYETRLVSMCKDGRLNRVVQVLESGKIERDPSLPPVLRSVPYLIFELAEGDIRSSIDVSKPVSSQWRFNVLHQTTLALLQLHGSSIAHQDLKPSNVLHFGNERLKIADLGRSSLRGSPAPHDNAPMPGARNYAPFEQRYEFVPTDWVERRLTADVFHLGCLTVFAFTNICFPEYVMAKVAEPYRPANWGNPYMEALPHIQEACIKAVDELSTDFPAEFRDDLVEVVLDLCHPDPKLRGRSGPKNKTSIGLLWLQRYVSRFDVLRKRAGLRKAPSNA
jgi:serine/threonine protein kinase